MKRALLVSATLAGGAIVVIRNLPAEWRESLSRLPATMMGQMIEHMPDE